MAFYENLFHRSKFLQYAQMSSAIMDFTFQDTVYFLN